MQAIYRETVAPLIPRIYRNRPNPRSFSTVPASDVIYLVDDDPCVREEISSCFAALELKVVTFASAAECLDSIEADAAACVILNIHLPDLCGLELQRRLGEKANAPIIFIGDQCDIASTVRAMKAGALDFLAKPFDLAALIAAVRLAFTQGKKLRQKKAELEKLQERFSLLTPREREVLPLVVGGLLNKQAASILEISEVTLQIHRSQVMRKMQAESFADLVRMAVKLRIPYWRGASTICERRQELPAFGGPRRSGSLMLSGIR
jgi:FixJ family two-component response regulator